MSEKFERIVNAPHQALGRATERIKQIKPDSGAGKTMRVLGMGLTGSFQFLLWAIKYVTLDNHLTRAGERTIGNMQVGKDKNGQDKKLQAFAKRYPNLSSHILYYMMLAMFSVGAKGYKTLNTERDDALDENRIELSLDIEDGELVVEPNTYGAYLARIQPIVPYLIADLIAKEGVHVDPKTGLHTPYLDSKGVPTIGFGSTVLMDGTSVTMNTAPITTQEAYELSRWHLSEETFFLMYCYDIAIDDVDINSVRQALSLGSVFYNSGSKLIEDKNNKNHKERFTTLRKDFKEYGYALPDSLVLQRFSKFPIVKSESFGDAWLNGQSEIVLANRLGNFLAGGAGLQWRRWMEAGLMTGDIEPQILLDCPVNGIYEFYKCMGKKKDKFFKGEAPNRCLNRETYSLFKDWLKNPVDEHGNSLAKWKKVCDYLPDEIVLACQNGKCSFGKLNKIHVIPRISKELAVDMYAPNYETQYNYAVDLYHRGDFAEAEDVFKSLLQQHPDNALLYNDLATTYNKLGKYDDAIACAQEIVSRIGDKKQYAAAQYNAGYAYERLGNLKKALENYKLSVANGNSQVQHDVKRVTKKLQKSNQVEKSGKKSKPIAFNTGRHKLQNGFIRKLNQYHNNTNNMA